MGVLAAAAALAAMFPLFRGSPVASARPAASEIYKDQLSELRRDVDDGRIADNEAEAARVEIARRLIHAQSDSEAALGGIRSWRRMSTVAIVLAPVAALGLYLVMGSPHLPDSPLSARLSAPPDQSDIAALIARTESYLAENPEDASGWEVIGPVYLRLARFDDAVTAFGRVIELLGPTAAREANLGESITSAHEGRVVEAAEAAFRRALELDPHDARSRFYVARGLEQRGLDIEAAAAWTALLADAPPGAPWIAAARGALNDINTRLGVTESGGSSQVLAAAPAPTSEDFAAAAQMSDNDRMAMIEGMVAGLADRLDGEPDDPEGWARLIRSYVVLDQRRAAQLALVNARSALPAGSRGRALIDATADELDLTAAEGGE